MQPRIGRPLHVHTAGEETQTTAFLDATTGVNSIVSALVTMAPIGSSGLSWQRKLAQRELYDIANTLTPYGLVCEKGCRGANGELEIYHVNPFALLALGCDKYIRFQQLLAVVAASSPGGMVDIV